MKGLGQMNDKKERMETGVRLAQRGGPNSSSEIERNVHIEEGLIISLLA